MIKNKVTPILSLVFLLALTGCQTDIASQFKRIKKGQEKDQVIEILGSPDRIRRVNDQDRWSYIYENDSGRIVESQIHFSEGRAVYAGPPPPESDAAENQDTLNEKTNTALEERLQSQPRPYIEAPKKPEPAPAPKANEATPLPEFQEIK